MHDRGIVRIRTKHQKSFGRIIMTDPVTVTFQAEEILIRTPAEHFINAKKYDMEIQVLHTAVMGEV